MPYLGRCSLCGGPVWQPANGSAIPWTDGMPHCQVCFAEPVVSMMSKAVREKLEADRAELLKARAEAKAKAKARATERS